MRTWNKFETSVEDRNNSDKKRKVNINSADHEYALTDLLYIELAVCVDG